jgi:hypothetical protein
MVVALIGLREIITMFLHQQGMFFHPLLSHPHQIIITCWNLTCSKEGTR